MDEGAEVLCEPVRPKSMEYNQVTGGLKVSDRRGLFASRRSRREALSSFNLAFSLFNSSIMARSSSYAFEAGLTVDSSGSELDVWDLPAPGAYSSRLQSARLYRTLPFVEGMLLERGEECELSPTQQGRIYTANRLFVLVHGPFQRLVSANPAGAPRSLLAVKVTSR